RRKDVRQRTVLVLHEGDERRPVRVILQPHNRSGLIETTPPEINQTVGPLVATADMAGGNAAAIVTATRPRPTLRPNPSRRALPPPACVHQPKGAHARP